MSKIDEHTEIELDLPDKVFMTLAMKAHKRNITLNELVRELLHDFVSQLEFYDKATDLATGIMKKKER